MEKRRIEYDSYHSLAAKGSTSSYIHTQKELPRTILRVQRVRLTIYGWWWCIPLRIVKWLKAFFFCASSVFMYYACCKKIMMIINLWSIVNKYSKLSHIHIWWRRDRSIFRIGWWFCCRSDQYAEDGVQAEDTVHL